MNGVKTMTTTAKKKRSNRPQFSPLEGGCSFLISNSFAWELP
jgi:hypothetical protein